MKFFIFLCLIVFLQIFENAAEEQVCLNDKTVVCVTSESQDCPDGEIYMNNVKFGNCCPGCILPKGENDICTVSEECGEFLKCNTTDGVGTCQYIDTPCWTAYKKSVEDGKNYKPDCLPDGSYNPKQCKGSLRDGKCFCVDINGKRIFGEEKPENADTMTCACSRLVSSLLADNIDTTLHCNDLGNFEELQCENDICWCADEKTGNPYTVKVPMKMMQILTCYSPSIHGDQYFRQCDSIKYGQNFARQLMAHHGTTDLYFPAINCNFDGSYGRVQIVDNKKRCTGKDGFPLMDAIAIDSSTTCNCAYDKEQAGGNLVLGCDIVGDYDPTYIDSDGNHFCVDADGFLVGGKEPNICNK